jgi:YVTN family beta-propeller protein
VNDQTENVSVIDTSTNTVVGIVPVGLTPRGVAITPDGAFAYVTNETDSTVSVIATATNAVVDTVRGVTALPEGLAIIPQPGAVTCR